MTNTLTGSCLCGRITFRVTDEFETFHLCHCTQCQKATGSAHASNLFAQQTGFAWLTGEERLKRFDVPGRAISQAFCIDCGSGMPYLTLSGSGLMVIPAGTLDQAPSITVKRHIFYGERAAWYDDLAHIETYQDFPPS